MYLLLIWAVLLGNPLLLHGLNNHPYTFQIEQQSTDDFIVFENKTIPLEIMEPVMEALSHFPDLRDVHINFEFKDKIKGSVMQAQPKVLSLFVDGKEKRKYRIKITRALNFGDVVIPVEEIPNDALVGWIGHELGHIMDYLDRSSTNMMRFGFKYLVSKQKVVEAELAADGFAIECGLGHQVLATKNYILNHDGFDEGYKEKIKTLYPSPEAIVSLQEEFEKVGEEAFQD
ncbi:hypothetical protein [Cecembia lonarensis]|uniref:Uncharacterized protein n=1 Tax=Cecembia lonarensis (strain CCUG 58316 / KCTC 22772 / LW9) TaxID=1225176 RepID=K1L5K2_CECL9|nr:hypothetical protein [Cecembia lonarensis]EKB47297.1 hypothetical protein B879_04102 [Cecembia lonarensis LW9]